MSSKRIKTKSRLWTEEELEILLDMMKHGTKLSVIAERLNRSYGSLQRKLYLLDHTIIGLMKSYVK